MTSKTITDRAGDTLRLSTGSLTAGPGEITIKVTERFRGREAVAAVHVDPVALRAALDEVAPAGSYTRTDEEVESDPRSNVGIAKHFRDQRDDLKHRLNLAVMASEHNSERAEKAEQERDEALAGVRVLARENIECHERVAAGCGHPNHGRRDHDCGPFMPAAVFRSLTPDAITDEFVDYVHEDYFWSTSDRVRLEKPALKHALLDAVKRLAETPARPEWEEEGAKALTVAVWGMEIPNEAGEAGDKLAFSLARHGYKVVPVTEEQP